MEPSTVNVAFYHFCLLYSIVTHAVIYLGLFSITMKADTYMKKVSCIAAHEICDDVQCMKFMIIEDAFVCLTALPCGV